MISLNFNGKGFDRCPTPIPVGQYLPGPAVILHRTPFISLLVKWDDFWSACRQLTSEIAPGQYIYFDASWDPFTLSNEEITQRLEQAREIFIGHKVLVLSARAQHFYDDLPGCLYLPLFLMFTYPEPVEAPRAGRIGCLNRRNAAHRAWLMYHLITEKLIDSSKDVYSMSFTNIYDDSYWDVDEWASVKWFNEAQRQIPKQVATHPDGFINDHTTNHPAWHTGVSIITETEPDINTLMSEKTAKGILSRSCFSIYMADVGYKVLEDLGFAPRFFPAHPEHTNIEPVIEICKTLDTVESALDYRQQHIAQINHNFDWFDYYNDIPNRPWWPRFDSKLQQVMGSL